MRLPTKQGQFPAILPLASLNGQNGFKIDGENNGDQSGWSVSAAGDINGDGHTDLLVAANGYLAGSAKGRSYVVFGGPGVGSNGTVALSSLNGANGFKLDGENNGDQSGWSVSATGDFNGDGYADLLVGAFGYPAGGNKGRSYVMFGGPGIGNKGSIALSSLNGTGGFKLDGENLNDSSGRSVSTAGDVNGDSHADLLVDAFGYPAGNAKGRSYVVFGGPGVGSSGIIALSSLNGSNGFKLDGENNGDYSGYSVSTAGDINGDNHVDLLVGAHAYPGGIAKGRSYVVFGGPGVGSSGIIALSGLNGSNGFKLDGENNGDGSGYSVSSVGDVNGDSYADLIIGAPYYNGKTGRAYIVFGSSKVNSSGLLLLSNLDGSTGFKMDGENVGDYFGNVVSNIGDINGDGFSDILVRSPFYNQGTGRGYVIFGSSRIGKTGLLALSSLNGINGFKLDGENINDQSGLGTSAGDVNGDGINDLIISAWNHSQAMGRTYIVFGDAPPVLVNNSLSLSVGATVTLNSMTLGAYDRNHNNNTLVFVLSGVTHGQFQTINNPGVSLVNFTQQQVTSGAIQFVHDGTLVPPSYNITVRSTGIAWVGPISAQINFIGAPQSYFPAILPLSSLNGQYGFKLDGEATGELSGYPVNSAGDVNGDGFSDLLIGAPYYNSFTGRSYIVFGGPGVGSNGLLSLANLTGTDGFKIDGEMSGNYAGFSASGGMDVNGDGYSDILIGALGLGRSYVIFGGKGLGNSGIIALSNLTSMKGFKLDSESVGSETGRSVSMGDINQDGYADLLIGADTYNFNVGRSYVIFGGPSIGNTSLFQLANLNGSNGFKLGGEVSKDFSGYPVAVIGDINGDGGADYLIQSFGYNNCTGRNYILFGGPEIGSSALFLLSNLNGVNGFKIDGESLGDYQSFTSTGNWGIRAGSAGDVNGDGLIDVIIGNPYHNSQSGRSYVLFGNPGVGSSGLLLLANLTGFNGFKLDGENYGDASGMSVGTAGDFNDDGYADIVVVAPWRGVCRSYVVFGNPAIGSEGTLALGSLDGINGFKLDGENNNFYSVASTAGDMNGDGISDLLIGASGHDNATGRSYVIFGDAPPTLVQNRLSLALGQTITLNQTHLSAYDRNHPNNSIVFIPTNVTHGHFQLTTQSGVFLANFTLPQLQSGVVQFVHDGSTTAPTYNITVQSAGIAWTGPYPANITFSVPPLNIVTNQLNLSNGQTIVLSFSNLQAVDPGVNNNSQIVFTVGNVQNGYFATVPSTSGASKNLTSFTQAQIQNGAVEFVHNGDKQAPGYLVIASDGIQSTLPSIATIDLIGAPIITQNSVNITTTGPIILTPAMLNVTAPSGVTPNQISLTVTHLQHATITSTVTHAPVSNFTLAEVEAGNIQFTPNGNSITPSYTITATVIVTELSSAPNTADVLFCPSGMCAPQLVNNYLTVTQGKATTLTNRYLSAQEPPTDQALDNSTMFYVSNIEYGHFSLTNQPQTWITAFSQQQLLESQVQFVQDGSPATPGYQTAVQAVSGYESASSQASIFFTPVNTPTPISNGDSGYSTIQKAIIGACISGGMGIGFALIQICLKRVANRKLLQALGEGTNDYDQNVVRPVAQEIAGRVKITGFLNATTNIRMRSFKSAVRSLLGALSAKGVDLDFKRMRPPEQDALINEIGNQTYRWVKSKRRGCTACCPGFSSFFKPQILPENLQDAADEIANNVVLELQRRNQSQVRLSEHLSVSGSPVFADPSSKQNVELDEISALSRKDDEMKEEPAENLSVVQLG